LGGKTQMLSAALFEQMRGPRDGGLSVGELLHRFRSSKGATPAKLFHMGIGPPW
jgi:hypothetical protein